MQAPEIHTYFATLIGGHCDAIRNGGAICFSAGELTNFGMSFAKFPAEFWEIGIEFDESELR